MPVPTDHGNLKARARRRNWQNLQGSRKQKIAYAATIELRIAYSISSALLRMLRCSIIVYL